jgi:hypothetical protein
MSCSLGEGVNSALEDAAILGAVAAECPGDGTAIAAAFDRCRRQVPALPYYPCAQPASAKSQRACAC